MPNPDRNPYRHERNPFAADGRSYMARMWMDPAWRSKHAATLWHGRIARRLSRASGCQIIAKGTKCDVWAPTGAVAEYSVPYTVAGIEAAIAKVKASPFGQPDQSRGSNGGSWWNEDGTR